MVTINDLLKIVESYSNDVEKIRKAYELAYRLHDGQMRQSGDPYIVHPLSVAYILALMHADADTICAGLLHDTLEDTEITKDEITNLFNSDVANLVDGVTKISKLNFSSKQDQNFANTRKIVTSIKDDVRIIIIKLADRLHNMRTLNFKSKEKQRENALETLNLFVPIAYRIGDYRIKNELEDLSLQYLDPEMYKRIQYQMDIIGEDYSSSIIEISNNYEDMLNKRNIKHYVKVRTKNIYSIYKRLQKGDKLNRIHDLIAFKIMVESVDDCYLTLMDIHRLYKPVNDKFKDYICNPKTNMYSSLHTTVFGEDGRLVQNQIRTFEMDKIASFGLTAYWDIKGVNARTAMQEELKNKCQFFDSLVEIDKIFGDNQEFVNQVMTELFSDTVYVYDINGNVYALPKGSTVIDFAYRIGVDVANKMVGAYVNGKGQDVFYTLCNKDRIKIVTNDLSNGPDADWKNYVYTTKAKCKIKEIYKNINN